MSNVVPFPPPKPTSCPDCGTPWPGMQLGERCPGCLLSVEEIQVAAEFLEELERRSRR